MSLELTFVTRDVIDIRNEFSQQDEIKVLAHRCDAINIANKIGIHTIYLA